MSHLDLFVSLQERSQSIANTLKRFFLSFKERLSRLKNSRHLTVSKNESSEAAFRNEPANTLQDMFDNRDVEWKLLESAIPHLDKRISMILSIKSVEDSLAQNYGVPIYHAPVYLDIRMGILLVQRHIGVDQTKRLLEEKPIAFFLAATITHIHRANWIVDDTIQTCHYLHLFFNTLSMIHLCHYEPAFTTLVSERSAEASQHFQSTAIAEIVACDFDDAKRQALVHSVKMSSETLMADVSQL